MQGGAVEQEKDDLPKGVVLTMDLLREGIDNFTLLVLRQEMDDGGDQVVYDLAVARVHAETGAQIVPIARLFPQLLQEEKLDPTAFEAPSGLH